jgi:transposase InsO family protein
MIAIRALIVRMATDNSSWGYCKIQGELKKLNHSVAPSTIAKTLKEHGILPAPGRPTSWRTFLHSHADVIAGTDFFTTEVWTARGLVTHYVLFLVRHATRAVHIAGITTHPDSAFMARVARNLTAIDPDFMHGIRNLILDRDSKFTAQFKSILNDAGITPVLICYQAPNMNAIAERWVLSVKSECINRMIFFGARSLQRALGAYCAHYHLDRPHQGLGNELITPAPTSDADGEIIESERLGGLLRSYHRAA